jgi:hypothetical protein
MPKGGKRRGAGRKRKPLERHVIEGTFRKDRHGHLAALPAAPAADPVTTWTPDPDRLAELSDAGRALVMAMTSDYEFTSIEGVLLLAAARCADRLDALRAVDRGPLALRDVLRVDAAERNWIRQQQALLAGLRAEP